MASGTRTLALRHQFANAEQQKDASTLGMWVFLVTEIMFFGGMFCMYTVYRSLYASAFGAGSNHLDVTLGAVSTVVLIGSSFTMALAVNSAATGNRRALLVNLIHHDSVGRRISGDGNVGVVPVASGTFDARLGISF